MIKNAPMSLARFLLVKGGVRIGISFLAFALLSAALFLRLMSEVSFDRAKSSQEWFTSSIADDILAGVDSAVFTKCQAIFKDKNILGVSIYINGRQVCDFKKPGSKKGLEIETQVYFDSESQSVAGRVLW